MYFGGKLIILTVDNFVLLFKQRHWACQTCMQVTIIVTVYTTQVNSTFGVH